MEKNEIKYMSDLEKVLRELQAIAIRGLVNSSRGVYSNLPIETELQNMWCSVDTAINDIVDAISEVEHALTEHQAND